MSKRKEAPPPEAQQAEPRQIPEPVDVADGIPDRRANPPKWRYALLAAIFAAWVAFLIYCQLAG